MKRTIYILATLLVATLASCNPKDEQMIAMDNFMSTQEAPGIYRDSQVEFTYDENLHQCYLNTSKLTFRIMDEGGDKYLQFTLSKAPVKGESVDVVATSYGLGLSATTTYKNLKVDKLEDDLCYLRSDAAGGYVGIIIGWME